MKVAVTGASGFIGRYVLSELTARKIETVAVVRDRTRIASTGLCHVVEMDLKSFGEDPYAEMGAPDVLIHLAWGGLPNYKAHYHFEVELARQYNFLKALVTRGLPAMIVSGTCQEYGMRSGAISEDMETAPNTAYALAKDTLRRELFFLKEKQNFALTWARLFYMYGEGQAKNSLYSQFMAALAAGAQSFDMSGGQQVRDFMPVAHIASALVALAINRADNGIVNVSSAQPLTVQALVEGWLAEQDKPMTLNLGRYPYADYEPMAFWGENGRLLAAIKKN